MYAKVTPFTFTPSLSSVGMRPQQKVGHRWHDCQQRILLTKSAINGRFSESRIKVVENESTGYLVLNVVHNTEL
jgi:hypothetical protein